ncbi:MAG: nicotinamide riboside transporter PnuC [Candidatus Cryptobacteroides sp.]|jgi:nicotinamide mononucleotide transporter
MTASREQKFNLAFNIFLVTGMLIAVTVATVFQLRQPNVRTFMLLLAGFGSVMGVVNTVMSANGNILTFVFGFIDVLIGSIVYLDNGIMGNFALHAFYFLPMQFVGFWQWRKRGAKLKAEGGESAKVRARRLTTREWLYVIIGLLIGMVVVYFILLFIDQMKLEAGKIDTLNRPKILLDAVVMVLNIAGQVLLSLAFMEQWYIWNLVNVASISLWVVTLTGSGASGYAVVMLIKYVFYLLNSINGLRIWLGLSREK